MPADSSTRWADADTPARRAILRAVLPLLALPTDRAGTTVAPVRFLLDAVDQQITLANGRLPLSFVCDAAGRFGWGLPAFTIRKEGDVAEVGEVRDLATRAGLIAVRRRQLTLTDAGRTALDDPAQLWSAATAGWFDHDAFATDIAEVAAALLLVDGPATSVALATTAHEAVSPSFHNRAGAHPDLQDARLALWDWLRPGHALGWLSYRESRTERIHQLTDPGRAAALEGLRHRSRAPHHSRQPR